LGYTAEQFHVGLNTDRVLDLPIARSQLRVRQLACSGLRGELALVMVMGPQGPSGPSTNTSTSTDTLGDPR
jgi:hypothetical protein